MRILLPLWLVATAASASPVTTTYSGLCDASAGVSLDDESFVIASDEDNTLRVFRRDGSTRPTQTFAMDDFLEVDADHPEADIEAATMLNGRTFWITSHGSNKDGEERESRRRFWATEQRIVNGRVRLETVGMPYKNLLQDLIRAPSLQRYDFTSASRRIPEAPGGLNIEGLAATPDGAGLFIGFRNPVPRGRALLVPMTNPEDVLNGERAIFGAAIELDLGGLGIRAIQYSPDRGEYLIVAGSFDATNHFSLYSWSGAAEQRASLISEVPGDLKPEEIILWSGEADSILLVSDDGDRQVNHETCKNQEREKDRVFRTKLLNFSF